MSSKKSNRVGISFSLKLSVLYAFFFTISSVSLFGVAYYVIQNVIEQREREVINVRMQEYRAWLDEGGLAALKTRVNEQSKTIKDVFFVRIKSPYDAVLFLSNPAGSKEFDRGLLKEIDKYRPEKWFFVKEKKTKSTWLIATMPLRDGILLQVGKRMVQSFEFLNYFRSVFIKFILPLIFLGIIVGGLLTFRAMLPVRRLIQTVRNILRTGEIDQRVPIRKEHGELDELVRLFNEMLDKNSSLIEAMKNSLDNVAHDLKTPMTRLRGIAEIALQDPENKQACLEALSDCLEESERVVTMLNTMMDVSEAEAGVMKLDLQKVSISQLVDSITELYELVAEEKDIELKKDIPDDLIIQADYVRLQQVIANLLDNAIKYSDADTTINITAFKNDNKIEMSVIDQGIGIAEEEMIKIWDRLYRTDQSRSKKGLGLGLSFVKAIVYAHQGEVNVKSEPGKGSKFIISLPA